MPVDHSKHCSTSIMLLVLKDVLTKVISTCYYRYIPNDHFSDMEHAVLVSQDLKECFKAEFGNRALLSLNFKSSCRCLAFVLLKTCISIKMHDVRL